jgi:hypothetical protein
MSSFEEQELKRLENALAALTPRPAPFDRDALLFEAGRRSAPANPLWCWSTLGMTAVAGMLAFVVILQAQRPPERVIQFVEAPSQAPVKAPDDQVDAAPPGMAFEGPDDDNLLPPASYWRMQQAALRVGIDQLPMSDPDAGEAPFVPREPMLTIGSRSVHATILVTGDQ